MGNCFSISKNIFCCSKDAIKDKTKLDLDLKKQKEYIFGSDKLDNKKYSNIAIGLKIGKLKLRTKTFKNNLNSNLLDDSDHIIHLRAKKPNKKKKRKNI